MLKRIKAGEATLGMYIQAFEGSWLSHPFWRAKFLLTSADDLAAVRASEVAVIIDTVKGKDVAPPPPAAATPPAKARLSQQSAARAAQPQTPAQRVAQFGKADQARAAELAKRSANVVRGMFEDCLLGQTISTAVILETVDDIAEALERDTSAFVNVTRLRAKDDYTYTHSVAVCALMISLARETGAAPDVVRDIGMAGLLHDIGKVAVADEILRKTEMLTDAEINEIRRHPEEGHKLLVAAAGVPRVALDVCLHHHERLDGSGYPFGLKGDAIGKPARMAAICDVYDAMTSSRPYKKGMPAIDAITEMDAAPHLYDPDLLFRFMRTIGVFPEGKLVRLRSNRLAVALPQKRGATQATFRAFYSTIDTRFTGYEDVVLVDSLAGEQALSSESPDTWFVTDWTGMRQSILQGAPALP